METNRISLQLKQWETTWMTFAFPKKCHNHTCRVLLSNQWKSRKCQNGVMKSRRTSISSASDNIVHPSVALSLLLSANLWKVFPVFLRMCRKTEEIHVFGSVIRTVLCEECKFLAPGFNIEETRKQETMHPTERIGNYRDWYTCEREAQKKINTRCPLRSQLQLSAEINQKEQGTFVCVPSSVSENCLQGNDCILQSLFQSLVKEQYRISSKKTRAESALSSAELSIFN